MNRIDLKVKKTARIFQIGAINENIKSIWILLHGYGQLGNEFISHFENAADDNKLIIAPEALNKFYLKGFYGKVGAAWMTKDNRENEIEDYVEYLNSVVDYYRKQLNLDKLEINTLGFSQGCDTLSRWVVSSNINFNRIILHSGGIPEDVLKTGKIKDSFDLKLFLIKGDNDKLINKEKLNFLSKELYDKGINYRYITFEGGHEISQTLVRQTMEGKFDEM